MRPLPRQSRTLAITFFPDGRAKATWTTIAKTWKHVRGDNFVMNPTDPGTRHEIKLSIDRKQFIWRNPKGNLSAPFTRIGIAK